MFCDLRPQSSKTLLVSANINTLESQSILVELVFLYFQTNLEYNFPEFSLHVYVCIFVYLYESFRYFER